MTAVVEVHDTGKSGIGGEDSERLLQTQKAFDALARGYDRSEETNELLIRLRAQVWQMLTDVFLPDARLLDLGCGTGIDAVHLAEQGCRVVATDLSPAMVARTRELAEQAGVSRSVDARALAIEDLRALQGERFDGIYSNRGPFNCADDLEDVARSCAGLLPRGGLLVTTVIGRVCPWETVYYARHRQWGRARLRTRPGFVSVPLQGQAIPTRYYTPRELYQPFRPYFDLAYYRGLGIFLPPTYLAPLFRGHPRLSAVAGRLDDALGGLPGIRNAGDLFLMVLTRRAHDRGSL
jgi:SAM-dependent methyltransferase